MLNIQNLIDITNFMIKSLPVVLLKVAPRMSNQVLGEELHKPKNVFKNEKYAHLLKIILG